MKITERNSEEEQSNSKDNSKPQTVKADSLELTEQKTLLKPEEPLEDENGDINISAHVVSQPGDGQSTSKSQTNKEMKQVEPEQNDNKEKADLLKKRTSSFLEEVYNEVSAEVVNDGDQN